MRDLTHNCAESFYRDDFSHDAKITNWFCNELYATYPREFVIICAYVFASINTTALLRSEFCNLSRMKTRKTIRSPKWWPSMMMCLSEDEFICMYTTVLQFSHDFCRMEHLIYNSNYQVKEHQN